MSSRKGSRGSTRRVDGESNLQSQSSNQPTHSEGANSNVGGRSSQGSQQNKRKRGPTRVLNKFGLRPGEKLSVQFNTLGQAIGPNAAHFAHILGSTLRHSNIVSLQAEGWWKVSKEEKDKLWKEITAVAEKNSGNRALLEVLHTGGSKSFACYREDMTTEDYEPTQIDLFMKTHGKKNGKVTEILVCKHEKFDEYLANQESASLTPNEFYITATGPVRHGRMHGYGLGAPPSKVLGPKTSGQSSFGSYSQVCNKLGNVLNEMDQLKTNMCERIEERVQEETKKIEERVQEETKKIEERMEERIQEKMMAFMAQYTQQCQQNRR
ncbi:hypothetical protein L1049_018469 [Liquidambar formosana]|uniref:Uncharacterized protein n=1 Tax=Liquidambar formosana TaxID=63359 RepID=A0AAP0RA51_LIQFO